jgi:hypothetical protein
VETVNAILRNGKNTEWIIVSQICLDRERYLRQIVEALDGFWFHSGFVEAFAIQRYIPVGVTNDFAQLSFL